MAQLVRLLVAAGLLLVSLPALAVPVDGGSRIGVQAGWNYNFNSRFEQQASAAGNPLASSPIGGPSVLATFAYRPLEKLEVAIELGYTFEQLEFAGGPTTQISRIPILLAGRYTPWVGKFWPYVGAGGGYFLNFIANGPEGSLESHGAGPVLIAGAGFDLTDRISLTAEYRLAFVRIGMPGVGFLNTGGNFLLFGAQYSFPPDVGDTRP